MKHRHLHKTLLSLAVFVLLSTALHPLFAQVSSSFERKPQLVVSPAFPTPNSTVRVTIDALSQEIDGAAIVWKIDGVIDVTYSNLRTIDVILNGEGTPTTIEATVTPRNAAASAYKTTITPGTVDIIIEPDTYVPLGYEGRALPSKNSTYRAVAVPHIYEGGKPIPSSDLIFTWTVNNEVLFGGSALGKNSITASIPRFSDGSMSVTVAKRDGSKAARSVVTLRSVQPVVRFYEESTLFGTVLSSPNTFIVPKDEAIFRAAPYYLAENSGQSSLSYRWTLNGATVATDSTDPRTITLRRTEGSGAAQVGFGYTSRGGALQQGAGSFNIQFTDEEFVSI